MIGDGRWILIYSRDHVGSSPQIEASTLCIDFFNFIFCNGIKDIKGGVTSTRRHGSRLFEIFLCAGDNRWSCLVVHGMHHERVLLMAEQIMMMMMMIVTTKT